MSNAPSVVVALSGGVDSALCAALLQEQGHRVHGIYMENWFDSGQGSCSSQADMYDARHVAQGLGIDFSVISLAQEYMDRVFSQFLSDHLQGLTPNPDVLCNQEIKFKVLLDHIKENYQCPMATGHYARIGSVNDRPYLMMGKDPNKDQSYFLCRLQTDCLKDVIFPLGEFHKSQVREMAQARQLPVAEKKDSTGICFIGERHFAPFLKQYLLDLPGPIIDIDKNIVLGEHEGLIFYTIGQRKGIGIGGHKTSNGQPWYVVAKDRQSQTLYVAQQHDHPALISSVLYGRSPYWFYEPLRSGQTVRLRTRHRQEPQEATVRHIDSEHIELALAKPLRALAPGQYAVFYSGETLLGSAIIDNPPA